MLNHGWGFESPHGKASKNALREFSNSYHVGGIELSLYDQYSLGCPGDGPIDKIFLVVHVAPVGTWTPDFLVETTTLYALSYKALDAEED